MLFSGCFQPIVIPGINNYLSAFAFEHFGGFQADPGAAAGYQNIFFFYIHQILLLWLCLPFPEKVGFPF
jgi:hypothetical protein